MTGYPVRDDVQVRIDRRWHAVQERLFQKNGCPFDPELLLAKLQEVLDTPASQPTVTISTLISSVTYLELIARKTWCKRFGDFAYVRRCYIEELDGVGNVRLETLDECLSMAGVTFGSRADESREGFVHHTRYGQLPLEFVLCEHIDDPLLVVPDADFAADVSRVKRLLSASPYCTVQDFITVTDQQICKYVWSHGTLGLTSARLDRGLVQLRAAIDELMPDLKAMYQDTIPVRQLR